MKQYNINQHRLPIPIPEKIKEARVARGFTISDLADSIGVTRQAVSQFELGHIIPKGEVLAKIIDTLELPPSFFSSPAKQRSLPGVTFFRSLRSATKKSREMWVTRSNWVEDIFLYLNNYFDFPKVDIPDLSYGRFLDDDEIEKIASDLRKEWGLGSGPISNLTLLLEKHGVVVVRSQIGDSKMDAWSQWRGDRPYIFLGSDKESAVRSRFEAAHELGHLLLHMGIDDTQINNSKVLKRIEKEAHRFAAAFLMPRETFCQEIMSTSLNHFISLKRRWKVSIAAMIYRCEDLEILSEYQILYLRKQLGSSRKKEVLDDELEVENPVMLKQAFSLLIENKVQTAAETVDAINLPPFEIEQLCNLPVGTLSFETKVIPLKFKTSHTD